MLELVVMVGVAGLRQVDVGARASVGDIAPLKRAPYGDHGLFVSAGAGRRQALVGKPSTFGELV